jgi:NAD(P)H-hydrate epimerase
MYILGRQQIREWDQYTITHEPIASVDLMERAALACTGWIEAKPWTEKPFFIFCGKGNNGGDGLAIARQLFLRGYSVSVFLLEAERKGTGDFLQNLQRLRELPVDIQFIQHEDGFPPVGADAVIVDALFGSGLNTPLSGIASLLVQYISRSGATIVSIDLPSGMFMDESSMGNDIVVADYTLTFQVPKLALLIQDNAPYAGEMVVLPIGLSGSYLSTIPLPLQLTALPGIQALYRPRPRHAHKGMLGHALLIAGSEGKMGAATLAVKACVHTGAGLTTAFVPSCGLLILQIAVPEAMAIKAKSEEHLAGLPDDLERYASIGIGPGIGLHEETAKTFSYVLRRYKKPVVIDADALNLLAQNKEWLTQLPLHSVLTPHPKEFDRVFGEHASGFGRLATAREKAAELQVVIVLKGPYTAVCLPDRTVFFNTTGNAGMAKGGSGDVLTGIITSLLAQGYRSAEAAILGVYLHGLTGELAADSLSIESMTPGDLISYLPKAFRVIGK